MVNVQWISSLVANSSLLSVLCSCNQPCPEGCISIQVLESSWGVERHDGMGMPLWWHSGRTAIPKRWGYCLDSLTVYLWIVLSRDISELGPNQWHSWEWLNCYVFLYPKMIFSWPRFLVNWGIINWGCIVHWYKIQAIFTIESLFFFLELFLFCCSITLINTIYHLFLFIVIV